MTCATIVNDFKAIFNINADISDINFHKIWFDPYDSLSQKHQFGEKKALLYRIECVIFNIEIVLRILCFKYDTYAEVLKLEITTNNKFFDNEAASCRNFLQRRRNVNLAFEVLMKFAKLFETRRLISSLVFEKYKNVTFKLDDAGMSVKCGCRPKVTTTFLELNWVIMWKLDEGEVDDFIEFYLNREALEQEIADTVREKLRILVEPNLNFHSKLKIWKSIMVDFYGHEPVVSGKNIDNTKTVEISDSDSDDSVVEIKSYIDASSTDDIMVID